MYIGGAKKSKRSKSIRTRRYKTKYNKSIRTRRYKTKYNKSMSRKQKPKMKKYITGGNVNAFNNVPIAFGYGMDGSSLSSTDSMLANPTPYKPYFACNNVV